MEKMLELACSEEIVVENFDFVQPLRGIYICQPDKKPTIGLATSLDTLAEKRSIMAEELGHHFTSTGYCLCREFYNYSARQFTNKIEYKALRWAVNYLIPDDQFLTILSSGLSDIDAIAQYFVVTPEMILFKIKLLDLNYS